VLAAALVMASVFWRGAGFAQGGQVSEVSPDCDKQGRWMAQSAGGIVATGAVLAGVLYVNGEAAEVLEQDFGSKAAMRLEPERR